MNSLRPLARLLAVLSFGLILHAPVMAAADPAKVLNVAFEAADDGFDLARTNSLYSSWLADAIFEPLLKYDYLARPAKLMPGMAEAMPEIGDDGKTYLFRIRKGILFTPDPAFKGVRRELQARDYAYTIKRHMDPKVRSVQSGSFEGKIVGMDALVAAAKKTGKFDYDAPLEGLETPDPYTLRIRLTKPDANFLYYLGNPVTGAIAREVAEAYGEDLGRHPVGTGAYMLKQYTPRSKIVLVANPDFKRFTWDFKSSGDAWDERIVKTMRGKQMPQIGRVEISIIEEEQARWLALSSGQLDLEQLSDPASPKVLDKGKLKPEYVAKGFRLYRYAEPGVTRVYFNFKDPLVGGFAPEKNALRRAITLAFNIQEEINQVRFGQAVAAKAYIPPGVAGHDPNFRTSNVYDPALAIKLLDHFGYKKGPDGFRTLPNGEPLLLKLHSAPNNRDKARMEIWKRSLDAVGLRADFPVSGFADNLKAAYRCELMMWGLGGTAAIPDGRDFLESYYGKNIESGNFGCYKSAAYDEAYEQALLLPDGPERQALYIKMQQIMDGDTVHSLGLWRLRNWMAQPWVQGFKKHPILSGDWQYLDIDKAAADKR